MNNQFDELAKDLARSVRRRQGVRPGMALIFCLAVAAQCACLAPAAEVYVDANASGTSDGSKAFPYARITDAVSRARQLRERATVPLRERIVIHVAAGTYHGSFDPKKLAENPQIEVLPIILNVPNLTLSGTTSLDVDARGIPTDIRGGPKTTLTSSDVRLFDTGHVLILITRTSDGGVGNRVTITGFNFKQNLGNTDYILTGGIFVDRVSDFVIRGNAFAHTPHGLVTRLASGVVEGNLFTCDLFGAVISGGSIAQPAQVTVCGNRAASKIAGGLILCGIADMRPLDLGANLLVMERPQAVYDRNNPLDLMNLPDTLNVTVSGNDSSDNEHFGLRVFAASPYIYATQVTTQPVTSVCNATITHNWLDRNGSYGFAVDAGFPQFPEGHPIPSPFTTVFTGTFRDNQIVGNGLGTALFTTTSFWATILGPNGDGYLQQSLYQVSDLYGELTDFDYENPIYSPYDGAFLNNTLVVNGTVIPPGTKITP